VANDVLLIERRAKSFNIIYLFKIFSIIDKHTPHSYEGLIFM